jgi:hypothetical protein
MDRFQHIELSRALGIGLEEAARLFSSTSQEVRKTAAEIMHADMTTEELAQRTRDAATAIDMLKTFFENAAIAVAPFVETMNKVVGGFMRFSESVFGGNGVAAAITTLIGSFTALKVATALVTGPWRLLSSGATALATRVLPSLGASAAASGTAAGFGAPGMLAFGGAVALIGAGAAAAAWGIAQIVRSIGEVAVIEGAGQAFKDIGAGMLSIGAASVAAMFGLGGLGALVFSVGSIVRKINKLDPDKASSFETIMSSLGDFGSSENLSANLTAVEGFVGNMSALLDDLPESKAIAFEGMTSGLAETLTQINALSPENIKQTIELVRVASETQQEATQTSGIAMIAAMHPMLAAHRQLVEILSDARNTVSETIIELDGTRLGSWLDRRSNQIAARVAEFRGGD